MSGEIFFSTQDIGRREIPSLKKHDIERDHGTKTSRITLGRKYDKWDVKSR
jgi:hypothetical protein